MSHGVMKYLDVSTAHCPHQHFVEECKEFLIADGEMSTFVYVPSADALDMCDIPVWLYYVFKLAILNDCYIVRFDPDGEDHDHLKKFDW